MPSLIDIIDNFTTGKQLLETSEDFANLKHVLKVSGMAAIGIAEAEGKIRTNDLNQNALEAPYIFK